MTIHVMAPKDHDGVEGPEQHCSSAHPYQGSGGDDLVVYHMESEEVAGHWICPACGEGASFEGDA